MATVARRAPLPVDKRALWKALRHQVLSPIMPVYLLFGMTAKYWALGLAYLSLSSFLFDPDGVLVWSFVALVSVLSTIVFAVAFFKVKTCWTPAFLARKRYEAYEPGSESELKAAIEWAWKRVRIAPFLLTVMLAFMAEPPALSFGIWREMQTPLVQSPRHPFAYSPREELRRTLAHWESRGIFTTSNPDQ